MPDAHSLGLVSTGNTFSASQYFASRLKNNVNKSVDDRLLSLVLCEWHFEILREGKHYNNAHLLPRSNRLARGITSAFTESGADNFLCLAEQDYENLPPRISDCLSSR